MKKNKVKKIIYVSAILIMIFAVITFCTLAVLIEERNSTSNEQEESIVYMLVFFFIYIVLVGLMWRAQRIEKNDKDYYIRDTKLVVEPVLAESIIDGKADTKNLIMACIVDLIARKNIKCLDNKKIQLVSYKNLSEIERKIVDMFFEEEGQTIVFDEVNNSFYENREKAMHQYNKIKELKKGINDTLVSKGFVDKNWKQFVMLVQFFSVILTFVSLSILAANQISAMIFTVLLYLPKEKLIFDKERYIEGNTIKIIKFIPLVCLFIGNLIWIIICSIIYLNILPICITVFAFSLLGYRMSKRKVFTTKGKEEYKNVAALKHFIQDYSLLYEKDLQSTILWEKYLAYAVAFGIPTEITKKISEEDINTNVYIQMLESFLST